MKKIISIILALCMAASLAACSSGKDDTQPTRSTQDNTEEAVTTGTAADPETTAPGAIDTDEKLFTVEIILPASMFEGQDMSDFDTDEYVKENGFIDAVVNDDGSITVTMTKAKHKELLKEMAVSMDESFAAFIEAADTPYIKEITHNDDFSSIVIKVDRAGYENAFDFTAFTVGFSAMFYQAFLDMEYHVEVSVIDADTGDVIGTTVYPDAFGE